jgi:hypothetical protein
METVKRAAVAVAGCASYYQPSFSRFAVFPSLARSKCKTVTRKRYRDCADA